MTCIILPVRRLTLAKGKGKEGKGKERRRGNGKKMEGKGGTQTAGPFISTLCRQTKDHF